MRRIARRNLDDDRGQAALIVLMLAVFFLLLLGLVSDGGLLLSQRRDLQGLADGAARAGAAAIDPGTVRTSHVPQIDPAVAQTQISRYLAAAGFSGSAQVSPTPAQVRVELSGTYSLAFAKLVGIGSATLHATSTSDPIPSG
jgi:Flp pilus assembly protein TadG